MFGDRTVYPVRVEIGRELITIRKSTKVDMQVLCSLQVAETYRVSSLSPKAGSCIPLARALTANQIPDRMLVNNYINLPVLHL